MKQKPLQTNCPHCQRKNTLDPSTLKHGPACNQCGRPLLPHQLFNLTDDHFPTLLRGEGLPWVVDFWAPGCAPCKRMAPTFEQLAKSSQWSARFAKINVDNYPSIARKQKIQSVPTLIIFSGNKPLSRLTGMQPKQKIQQWLNSTIGR